MKFLALVLLLSFSSITLQAREVASINIPEYISFTEQSTKLILNDAGIRTKYIFDIYIGSLYLESKPPADIDLKKAMLGLTQS